ncbi:MAG: hypothetical protein KDB14_27415, partial [Planctomycetales bacterium]|nr:hypothetical protein [Planctomycetales bacterium]
MPEGQKAIYFLTGPTREALQRDPRLELFRKHRLEVLYLYEAADEFVLSTLAKYNDVDLVSADQAKAEDLKLGAESEEDQQEDEEQSAASESIQTVIDRFKQLLGERVIDVRASGRLVDSPACLVGDDSQMSGHMERMMRMMNRSEDLPKRVLELNPRHALIKELAGLLAANPQHPFVDTACEHLFEGCMLLDGYLTDPHKLVERMNAVLTEAAKRPN